MMSIPDMWRMSRISGRREKAAGGLWGKHGGAAAEPRVDKSPPPAVQLR